MHEEIKVHVVSYGRKSLYMRYKCPLTGKSKARSTGCCRRRDAERAAARWEAELREGRYKPPSKITWVEFRHRYEDEVVPSLADRTGDKIGGVFNTVEKYLNPERLAQVTAERLSFMQSKLREAGRSEATIKGILSHLQAALRWAKDHGLLNEVPKITMPKRAARGEVMKGRPITAEEFERMLSVTPRIVAGELHTRRTRAILDCARLTDHLESRACPKAAEKAARLAVEIRELRQRADKVAESWRHYLRGLWWSGLRLEESLNLFWDRVLPIAPEFAEFLDATPEAERSGRVFGPMGCRSDRLLSGRICRVMSQIGKAAGIKVSEKQGAVKYASAHDLRRAFGLRWSRRVMPAQLKELMRHESIDTTMKFYVGQNAESTAATLWNAVGGGNTSGNSATDFLSANEKTLSQPNGATGFIE